MKPYKGFDRNDTIQKAERLPVDGYVCKILEAIEERPKEDVAYIKISFDIADGDYKGFYAKNYSSQTGEDKKWKGVIKLYEPKEDGSDGDAFTKRKFNTFVADVEASNAGYEWAWNEATLKGKLIGIVMRDKEYDYKGRTGFWTEPCILTNVEAIRSGNYQIPDKKYLNTKLAPAPTTDGWIDAGVGDQEELPFA